MNKVDRKVRKIIVESRGIHMCGSKTLLYLVMERGGRAFQSVENECKAIKNKAAVRLYEIPDSAMQIVRDFEETSATLGHQSLVKEATK